MIQGCAILWSTSLSFLRFTYDAARGLQCLQRDLQNMDWQKIDWRHILSNHDDARDQLFRSFSKKFFTLLLGVAYSVSKSESSPSSEVRNYDHHRQETNKQMRETNTSCAPFDVFLFCHCERYEKVDHVHHRGLKERVANRFSTRPCFAGLFRAMQAPCCVANNSQEPHGSTPQICTTLDHTQANLLMSR